MPVDEYLRVQLVLLKDAEIDPTGRYIGPLPCKGDVIDVLTYSRRIYPARVTHVDLDDAQFRIRAEEIELTRRPVGGEEREPAHGRAAGSAEELVPQPAAL